MCKGTSKAEKLGIVQKREQKSKKATKKERKTYVHYRDVFGHYCAGTFVRRVS